MPAPKRYPDELRARAVRLYRESDPKPVMSNDQNLWMVLGGVT